MIVIELMIISDYLRLALAEKEKRPCQAVVCSIVCLIIAIKIVVAVVVVVVVRDLPVLFEPKPESSSQQQQQQGRIETTTRYNASK